MPKSLCHIDPIMLSHYADGEVKPDEAERIRKHLSDCPDCRKAVKDNQLLSSQFQNYINLNTSAINPSAFETNVLAKIHQKDEILRDKIKHLLFSKKILVPVTAMASVVFLLLYFSYRFTFLNSDEHIRRFPVQTSAVTAPSAIIDSFSGETSAVMIMQTPHSNETILWYNEKV